MKPKIMLFSLIVAVAVTTARAFTVDTDIPAGNAIVNAVEGDRVSIRQDMRGTKGEWFYWAFRVRGAAGRAGDAGRAGRPQKMG